MKYSKEFYTTEDWKIMTNYENVRNEKGLLVTRFYFGDTGRYEKLKKIEQFTPYVFYLSLVVLFVVTLSVFMSGGYVSGVIVFGALGILIVASSVVSITVKEKKRSIPHCDVNYYFLTLKGEEALSSLAYGVNTEVQQRAFAQVVEGIIDGAHKKVEHEVNVVHQEMEEKFYHLLSNK